MRLDHLLSKEHVHLSSVYREIHGAKSLRNCSVPVALMGGTLTLMPEEVFFHLVRCFGSWNGGGDRSRHDARCWVLRDRNMDSGIGLGREPFLWTFFCPHQSGCSEGYRPYFENYTVDASILNLCPSGSNYKDQQHMSLRVCVFRSLVNFLIRDRFKLM